MDCSIGLTILDHISLFLLEGGGLSGGDIPDDIAREAKKVSLLPSGRRGGVAKLQLGCVMGIENIHSKCSCLQVLL